MPKLLIAPVLSAAFHTNHGVTSLELFGHDSAPKTGATCGQVALRGGVTYPP